jgi:membrane protein DedA with SNARE-associated domain
MKPFERLVKRYGAAAAFVAAATPIPDDLIYVPLGLARYSPWRFFVSTFVGKIILCYIIVLIAHYFGINYVDPFLEHVKDPTIVYVGFAIFVAIMVGSVLMVLRLNWEKLLGRFAPWTVQKDDD